jgi:hypothetical protein
MKIPNIGTIPLKRAPNGHLLLPLFEFEQQALAATDTVAATPEVFTIRADDKEDPKHVREIRAIARDTRGPQVNSAMFDRIQALALRIAGEAEAEIIDAVVAYRPKRFRVPHRDLIKDVTHTVIVGINPDGMTVSNRKWSLLNKLAGNLPAVLLTCPLVLFVFAKVRPVKQPNKVWQPVSL